MFCSECGKTIDDEAVICPECGAVTKKGILKLQEAAKQGAEVKENQDFTTIKPKDDSKIMRLVAMIIGLVGSALLLSSLLGEFASTTAPIIGKYSISVSNYLDKLTIVVVLLAGFSIAASLLKYSILQIVTGTLTGAWIGYSMWDIQSKASTSEISGLIDINFGMGRTKAGKSTLHSVLLGGLNSDFIGRGSERTTRYNFVYDFEGMRIIDTPGIGAPGGKSDTEIAKEVADESDLICYVVTSDSIQETEFNFLKQLKDRNKPVLIMLNKKDNITRSEKKLQKFLDNPLGWYESDGEDAIQGHIDRINTYVQMNHDFHNFSIVPVHLLAAKLALKEEDPVKKEKLLTGSRINEFLKTLSDMVSSSGIIQRSQTIYNSAIYHLGEDKKSASEQIEVVGSLRKAFWKNSEDSINKIKEYSNKKRNDFITSFNSTFDAFLKEDVRRFADENYYLNSKELNDAWKQFLSSSQLERRLEVSYNKNWEQYQSKVQDILVEAEEDLNFSMEFGSLSNVKVGRVVDAKFAVGVVGSVLGLVGAICFFFSGPIGLALTGAGIIAGIIAAKMKDKEQRINSAQDKLYDSLFKNVEKMREKNLTELLKKYDSSRNEIIQQLIDYNNAIIISLDKINESMKGLDFNLKETIQDLNDAFGARIANYMIKAPFYSINDPNAMSQLTVEREFKKYILLKDSRLYIQPMHVDKEKMSDILQEKLYINEEVV